MELYAGLRVLISAPGMVRMTGRIEAIRTVRKAPKIAAFGTPADQFIPSIVAAFHIQRIALVDYMNERGQPAMFSAYETREGDWTNQHGQFIYFEACQQQ